MMARSCMLNLIPSAFQLCLDKHAMKQCSNNAHAAMHSQFLSIVKQGCRGVLRVSLKSILLPNSIHDDSTSSCRVQKTKFMLSFTA